MSVLRGAECVREGCVCEGCEWEGGGYMGKAVCMCKQGVHARGCVHACACAGLDEGSVCVGARLRVRAVCVGAGLCVCVCACAAVQPRRSVTQRPADRSCLSSGGR